MLRARWLVVALWTLRVVGAAAIMAIVIAASASAASGKCRSLTVSFRGHAPVCTSFRAPRSVSLASALRLAQRYQPRLSTHRFGRVPSLAQIGARVVDEEAQVTKGAKPHAPTFVDQKYEAWAAGAAGHSEKVTIDGRQVTVNAQTYADDANFFDAGADGTGVMQNSAGRSINVDSFRLGQRWRTAKCPSADGEVQGYVSFVVGAGVSVRIPGLLSGTGKLTIQLTGNAIGHVGDDGKLKTYDLKIKGSFEQTAHNSVVVFGDSDDFGIVAYSGELTRIDPHKPVDWRGHLKNGRLGVFGLPYQIAAEREPGLQAVFETFSLLMVEKLNESYLKSEQNFYDDAACLKMTADPQPAYVSPGESVPVHVSVHARGSDDPVAQMITAASPESRVSPGQGTSTTTSPADFTIVTGKLPYATVHFEGLSNRGRALLDTSWPEIDRLRIVSAYAGQGTEPFAAGCKQPDGGTIAEDVSVSRTETFIVDAPVVGGTRPGTLTATGAVTLQQPATDSWTPPPDCAGTCGYTLASADPGRAAVTVTMDAAGRPSSVQVQTVQDVTGHYDLFGTCSPAAAQAPTGGFPPSGPEGEEPTYTGFTMSTSGSGGSRVVTQIHQVIDASWPTGEGSYDLLIQLITASTG